MARDRLLERAGAAGWLLADELIGPLRWARSVMALRAGQASAAAMVQRGDGGRLAHGRPRQLLLLALGLCAAQPPPPAELGDGELCESGDGSVRDGLEALCCGGMRCIWNDVYPLQCSLSFVFVFIIPRYSYQLVRGHIYLVYASSVLSPCFDDSTQGLFKMSHRLQHLTS